MASTSVSQGRVALVTGAGQGIGRAIALRLASDGFDVALNDLQANEANLVSALAAIEAVGRKGCYIFADVSQETEVEQMISKVVEELGGLDVVRSAVACRERDLISTRWSATLGYPL